MEVLWFFFQLGAHGGLQPKEEKEEDQKLRWWNITKTHLFSTPSTRLRCFRRLLEEEGVENK